MTYFEVRSTLVSCIAAFIALVVWNGQRKMQREANDLQRATAELAKKQLEILIREEKGKNTARVSLDLVKEGKSFKFQVTNRSDVEAREVEVELLLNKPSDNPIIQSEYNEKFPAKRVGPGSSISLIAALHFGSPTAFNARVSWVNPDGSKSEEETYVAL